MANLVKHLVAKNAVKSHTVLVDVGCSMTYFRKLDPFRPRLRVFAFDPLLSEIERLKRDAPAHVTYEDAFIVSSEPPEDWNAPSNAKIFADRTAHVLWSRLVRHNPRKDVFNAGQPLVYTKRKVTLDERFPETDVDFIKIDTDGHDFQVIEGAQRLLARKQLLGAYVEVRFHGRQSDKANLWRNVDRLLCENGLSLFSLRTSAYSRAALPGPLEEIKGGKGRYRPSGCGQLNWGDALYLRDLTDPSYQETWGVKHAPEKYLKLAGLFDIFDLPDCAADLIKSNAAIFSAVGDCGEMLDILAREYRSACYSDYMNQFEEAAERQRLAQA